MGYQKFGIPQSGAMDQRSAILANLLVHNHTYAPVLEATQIGPKIYFQEQAMIAITGADMTPSIDGTRISMNQRHVIKPGQTLSYGRLKSGYRCYIGIHGLSCDTVLGSCSQYPGITTKSRLQKGDELSFETWSFPHSGTSKVRFKHEAVNSLTVFPGSELDLFEQLEIDDLLSSELLIRENDRMGYQIEPPKALRTIPSILTVPVVPGTIQLTPSGRLMALMRDAQVTGGYPRIFQLSEASINQLAQMRTGEQVRLKLQKLHL
ncbi:biotin-dependent carboxyltransferase family protein [Marinoscillum sp. MHG1-6]|uniref:5-oxoprolinase subunit C family protein n=1 Tax=Marinoscillum sp. MHG1-6 TaxID=2959627 RepID=UPI002157692D|nr:biotin-dependent carboxyltransferase family protein [Marinoscillum sp. MHG1-6]